MKNTKKIIFVNSGMAVSAGHDYVWNLLLQSECNSRNIKYNFLFKKEISLSILKQFSNSYAALTNTFYAQPFCNGNIVDDTIDPFIKQSKQIVKDFKSLTIDITHDDLLFCHSADPATILGILWWCATLPKNKQPSLLFFFHFSFSPLGKWASAIFFEIRKALSFVPHAQFYACVDYIASFLTTHLGKEVTIFPMPFDPQISRTPSKDITYGFVGGGRLEQGSALLAPLAREYIKRGGKNKFIFQIGFTQKHPDIIEIKQDIEKTALSYPEQIQLIPYVVTEDEYYKLLKKCSLVLLPYDPIRYHMARPSMIVQESIAMGIPALVCKGGSLAYELTKAANGSIIIEDLNIHTLCDALFEFEATSESRLQQAKISGEYYRKFNNINNLMQLLMNSFHYEPTHNDTINLKINNSNYNSHIFCTRKSFTKHIQKIKNMWNTQKQLKLNYKLLLRSQLFERNYYLITNPDVYAAGMDPLLHFVRHGWQEGRKPNPLFDPEYYLAVYPDVAEAGMNPLCHYIEYGWKEERNPSAQFNTLKYLENNEDVQKAHMNPLEHFLKYGLLEGRNININ